MTTDRRAPATQLEAAKPSLAPPSRNLGSHRFRDVRDLPNDVVVGVVERTGRTAIEVRLRDRQTIGRVALVRVVRRDQHGDYNAMSDNSLCGVTISAGMLSELLDVLEKAEDALFDEGALK